jgi:hypothetical protein
MVGRNDRGWPCHIRRRLRPPARRYNPAYLEHETQGRVPPNRARMCRAIAENETLWRVNMTKKNEIYRHKKTGTHYFIEGIARAQTASWFYGEYDMTLSADMEEMVIYRSMKDYSMWARPRKEFEDGRFEKITDT